MKRIKRFANRMLAVMLAGTLTAGSLSLSVYGAEDAGSTAVPETEILYDEANEDRMTESSPTEEISEEVMTETSEGGFWDASESAAEDDAVVSYTITLDANGGYFADEWDDVLDKKLENTGILNKIIPVGGTVSTVPVNEKEDTTATFLGWSFEPDGELLPQEQEGYAPVGDGVLYAVWGYEDAAEDADAVEGTDENEFEKDSSDLDASDTSNAEGEANLESEIEEAPADETVEDENARDTEVTYTVTFDANGGYFDNESVHEQEQTVIDDVSGEPELSDTNVNDSSINGNAEGENSGNLDEVSPDNVQTVRSEESKPDANAVIQADPDLSYSEKKSDPELADAELSDEIEQVIPERASYAGTNPSCVVGFWGGHKYQIFEEDTSPIEAQKICTSLGGYLVTITSAEEQAFIGRLADLGVSDGYTIGGTDIEQEGVWTWVTGEPWNYTNWYPGGSAGTYEPNNGMGAGEDYLYISKSRNWNWVDWYGEYDNYEGTNPFICEWDSGNSSLDDHIYKRFDEFKTWTDAEVYCESLGGHLATITSSEENNRVLDISQSGSKNAYWIGARIEENGEASWVTHELLSYTNWANDEPDDYQTKQGYVFLFGEDYISSKYYVGQWGDIAENGMSWNNDSFWGSSNFGFLCEWDYILGLTMELSSRDKEKNYTGSEIKPLPTVRSKEGKILFNGYDYTLSYENNIDPGLATIIATGTGDYEGQSASISFKILDVVNISLDSEIEGIVDEDLPISAEIKSGHFVPSSSNMSWSVTGPKGSNENLPEIGPMEIVKDSGNTFVLSSIFHFSKAGEYTVTLSSDQGDSASATITVTPESVLKITQPVGGKKLYSYAGDVQAEKQFSMTLDKADKQPKASDFHFSVKKSDDLRNKPTNEVSGSNAEVKSIKKVGDRKYEIFFSYKPDDTGFYGLTVTYKDNKDDTELMVYDSQFLDKLEKDFDKEIKNYIKSYGKRLKSEANSLRKEDDNSIDYLLLAKDLKKDSSNILTGSGIGDLGTEKADVESLDNCAYEALARYLQKAGSKAGVKFDKVDNDTAASMIVQRITNIIIIDDDLKNVTLDSKATLGSNKYTVKVNTHIYPGGNGSVTGQINLFVQTQDRGEKSYSYYVKMGNKNSVEAAVADFLDALNDLNIDAQRNVAEQWYEELKDLLEWDFISDIEKSKEEYFEELSEDIAGGLERHGLTKIIDKIKVYRNYYKKYTGIIEKIKKAKTVLKKGLSGEQTSLSEIESIEINSGESGEYSKEIYDLMIKAEGKWKEYMRNTSPQGRFRIWKQIIFLTLVRTESRVTSSARFRLRSLIPPEMKSDMSEMMTYGLMILFSLKKKEIPR